MTSKVLCKKILLPLLMVAFLAGCKAVVPKLAPMRADAPVATMYSDALGDLNTILEVYLPPEYPDTYYYVKPVVDATGLSQTGEIPLDITALVRDAISQVFYKVRLVERYDETDIVQIQAELLKLQVSKLQGIQTNNAQRPAVDFTIVGRIAQFDRNLESQSDKVRAMANFAEGLSRTDISASGEAASRLSRLSVSFSVFNPSGISVPGKFGASMEVAYAKNGMDLGFAIFGNGLGFGTEATAMHGRHLALQMMTEFSVVQIIGRTLNIPYWRVGAAQRIFTPDKLVLGNWREQYAGMGGNLVAFMQSQCIACGDSSVMVTGVMDAQTQTALDRLADKFGVKNRVYPNYEMFRALEEHRLLNTSTARAAWGAYNAFKGGARPAVQSAPRPGVQPASRPGVQPASRPEPSTSPSTTVPKARQPRPAQPNTQKSAPVILEDLI